MSAFALEDGVVYHTYSAYARGVDGLWGMYQWLDRAPQGRNEAHADDSLIWLRRHDEYDRAANPGDRFAWRARRLDRRRGGTAHGTARRVGGRRPPDRAASRRRAAAGLPNVLGTNHIAWYSDDSTVRLRQLLAERRSRLAGRRQVSSR